jgi:hypothetical protein
MCLSLFQMTQSATELGRHVMDSEITGSTESTRYIPIHERSPRENESNFYLAYKLFYGEWRVAELLTDRGSIEDVEGLTLEYTPDMVRIGDKVAVNPHYAISLIPIVEERQNYTSYEVSVQTITGQEKGFFVYVRAIVEPWYVDDFGLQFYIRDDDTLVMEYDQFFVLLKRVRHIEEDPSGYYFPP